MSQEDQNNGRPPKKKLPMPFEGKIGRLEKTLYSRNAKFSTDLEREEFTPYTNDAPESEWKGVGGLSEEKIDLAKLESKGIFLKRFFTGAVLFFLLCVGVAFFLFFAGKNVISPNNIAIDINGPINVVGGENLPLDITIKNENNADILSATLVAEFPQGTRSVVDMSELTRLSEDIGQIKSGGFSKRTISSAIFGEKDSKQEIKISLDYKVANSSSVFHKEKIYAVTVISVPVEISVDYYKEINSGQKNEFLLTVSSNSNIVLKNLNIIADYPRGFSFEKALPSPDFSNNIWTIDELKPEEKKVIRFTGKIEGQDGEDVIFRLRAGLQSKNDYQAISSNILSLENPVSIKKPFVSLQVFLNGDTSIDHIENFGRSIESKINWLNNLPTAVTAAELAVKITGSTFDTNSVSSSNGIYKSSLGIITWNSRSIKEFEKIESGGFGGLTFNFTSQKPSSAIASKIRNPEINMEISISGKRLSENNVPESLNSTIVRKIKFNSDLNITSRLLYYSGPFKNTGNIPPKADSPTTYTVVWTVTNSFNDVSGTSVRATLPAFVKWLNVISPASEKVTYKPLTGEIVWDLGDIKAGTGFSTSPKEVSFQIEVIPTINQIASSPVVVSGANITGKDTFTKSTLSNDTDPLTTELSADPAVDDSRGAANVVK